MGQNDFSLPEAPRWGRRREGSAGRDAWQRWCEGLHGVGPKPGHQGGGHQADLGLLEDTWFTGKWGGNVAAEVAVAADRGAGVDREGLCRCSELPPQSFPTGWGAPAVSEQWSGCWGPRDNRTGSAHSRAGRGRQ